MKDWQHFGEERRPEPSAGWHDRITEARERGEFSENDKLKASRWFSCACGEIDVRIPRVADGEPRDFMLKKLGLEFSFRVNRDDFDGAQVTLAQIEIREQELIAKIEAGEKK